MGERQRHLDRRRAFGPPARRVHLSPVPDPHRQTRYERFVKPGLDRAGGLLMCVLALPLIAVCAALVRFTMGKPAIFKQVRVGQDGRPFVVYKLRTMLPDRRSRLATIEHEDRRRNHKSEDDPRHTPLGQQLRRWSLDELPQVWNVVKGDMSIVGPRPELLDIVASYEPWQHRRHEVRPGLTGLWQITARGEIPMHEATHLDIEYVENVTLREDLRILLRTPGAMLGGRRGQ